jgi:hypothetical protein
VTQHFGTDARTDAWTSPPPPKWGHKKGGNLSLFAAHQELVWLEDLNSLHDLRELETALPSMLHFNIKRLSGENIKLHLQENKRLNANAPVYVGGSLNGKHTAMEADVPLISVRYCYFVIVIWHFLYKVIPLSCKTAFTFSFFFIYTLVDLYILRLGCLRNFDIIIIRNICIFHVPWHA